MDWTPILLALAVASLWIMEAVYRAFWKKVSCVSCGFPTVGSMISSMINQHLTGCSMLIFSPAGNPLSSLVECL